METNMINVMLVQAGRRPRMVEMEDSLEAMQKMVGGYIEEYMPFEDDVALVCNEEGKMNGLELNRAIFDEKGGLQDVIAGDFFICYAPVESENFLSLPDDLAAKYGEKFKNPEQVMMMEDGIKVVPMKPKAVQRDER